jgi:hypothetical protein
MRGSCRTRKRKLLLEDKQNARRHGRGTPRMPLSDRENYQDERPLRKSLHCDDEDEKGDVDDA